jgi:hypothetical protein
MTAARRFALVTLVAATAAAFGQKGDYIKVSGTITEFDASKELRLAPWKGGEEVKATPVSRTRYYLLVVKGYTSSMKPIGSNKIKKGMDVEILYSVDDPKAIIAVHVLPKEIAEREKNPP